MEGKLQTSFIPKKPLIEKSLGRSTSINFFSIVGWFIFLVVLAACVGVFLYEQYLTQSIASKEAELTNIMNSFDNSSIDHFVQLDARLKAANSLLNSHLAFSTMLDLIAKKTIASVQFTSLSYTNDGTKIQLDLSGKAPDFSSIALQSDTFSSQPYLKNQIFSGLGLDQNGGVLFKFDATVDPSAISYKNSVTSTAAVTPDVTAAVVPTAQVASSTTATSSTNNN